MKKVLLILRHEVYSLLRRKSFWIGLLGLPLVGYLIYGGAAYLNAQAGDGPSPADGMRELFTPEESKIPQGYVDRSGIIQSFPADFPHDRWIPYSNPAAARQALDAGNIRAFYVIEPDYLETGQLTVYSTDFSQAFSGESYGWLEDLLTYNLLDGDTELIAAARKPFLKVEEENIAPQVKPIRDRFALSNFLVPYAMMSMLLISIMGSSSLMLSSISKEKENRSMEMLLLSASPHQMLLGKMTGLGLVGLLQVAVWTLSAMTLLRLGGSTFGLPQEAQLAPATIIWAGVFFVLSYLLNGIMMAGLGALVPSMREASQITMIIILPMLTPFFLLSVLLVSPNGAIAIFLSLFPFTAPLTMILRLCIIDVPLWQTLLSAALLATTALLMIRLVAGMFRAQTILSGQKFSVRRLLLALAGKV